MSSFQEDQPVVKRYFFDLGSDEQTVHDFQGRQFKSNGEAGHHAQMLAINLQYDPDCKNSNWTVLVREARGLVVHSVPVPPPDPGCTTAGEHVQAKLDKCAFGDLEHNPLDLNRKSI